MDYFEGVVIEYLRADRSLFVNTQCCIQLNEGFNPDTSGPHWYCDAVAVSIKSKAAYLCEITYASPPASLFKRLESWASSWPQLRAALARDSGIPQDWAVTPWIFVPQGNRAKVEAFASALPHEHMPVPKVQELESVMPWLYRSWDRVATHGAVER